MSTGPQPKFDDVLALAGMTDCEVVPGGASVSGGKGDAIIEVDRQEHQRRVDTGFVAATDMLLLDRLLTLPYDQPVSHCDLSPLDKTGLQGTTSAVVEKTDTHVRRLLRPAVHVNLVVVRSASWRAGLRQAAAFEPFAQRILLVPALPRGLSAKLWEADCLGVGVWVDEGDHVQQLVAPAPWQLRHVKAAGWRFTERIYAAWRAATATSQHQSSGGGAGRLAQQAAAGADRSS